MRSPRAGSRLRDLLLAGLLVASIAPSVGTPAQAPTAKGAHHELILAAAEVPAGVEARFVESRGAVSVVELTGGYDRHLPDGSSNVGPRRAVARAFFGEHPDAYDFVVVFSTFPFDAGPARALAWVVRNDVLGIGLPLFDQSAEMGSAGELESYVDMANLGDWETDPLRPGFEETLEALGHEILHRWAAHVRFQEAGAGASGALLGADASHWSFLLDSGASVLYGNDWRDDGNGTFTSVATRKFYSPLDLYLAGFLAPAEVPPMLLIEAPEIDPTRLPERGARVAGTARTVRIEDIVAAEGPRVPAAGDAPREFRAAFVLLTRPGEAVTDAQVEAVERVRRRAAARFAALTGGRGLLHVEPQVHPPGAGAADPLEPGEARPGEASLAEGLAWLRARQVPQGYWEDRPATRVRDTATSLEVLRQLDPLFAGEAPASSWLAGQPLVSLDERARRAAVLGPLGGDADALLAARNSDGGWGAGPGYGSDPLDTALALSVLLTSGASGAAADSAVAFLEADQNPDGGWSPAAGGPSRTSVTAEILRVLERSGGASEARSRAAAFLSGRQNPDGGFGDSPSTVHDTARVVEVLSLAGELDRVDPAAARAYLAARQEVNGSWSGSVFATSRALGALQRLSFANWTFLGEPEVEPAAPRDGERVRLSLQVLNDGSLSTPPGLLRLHDGLPEAGGPVVGEAALPPLAAGGRLRVHLTWDSLDRPGTATLVAVLDPDGAAEERSEQDNRLEIEVEVADAPAEADLEVREQDVVVLPETPSSLPVDLGFAISLRNLGRTDAPGVLVRLLAGEDEAGAVLGEAVVDLPQRSSTPVHFTHLLETPGVSVFTVVVDPEGAVAEARESNNRASRTVSTASTVDLEVRADGLSISGDPILGRDLLLRAVLRNRGTLDAPEATLRFAVDDGSGFATLAERTLQVPAGSEVVRELIWRVDRLGNLELGVFLDPEGRVPEADEGNNEARLALTTGELTAAELTVDEVDVTATPDPALEGSLLRLASVVRNLGGEAAPGVEVAFHEGDPAGGGRLLGTTRVDVPARGTALAEVEWARVPDASDRLVFVVVDPADEVAELSEEDNVAFRDLRVLSLPDLAVGSASLTLSPLLPAPGEPVTLSVTVANLGEQAAGDVVIRAWDGEPGAAGAPVAPDVVLADLAGNGTAQATFSWTFSAAGGERPLVVEVDPDGSIEEGSEVNNRARLETAVQEGDLYLTAPIFSPDGDGVLDETRLFFRLDGQEAEAVEVHDPLRGRRVRRSPPLGGVAAGDFVWDGRDTSGRVVPDGVYRMEVVDVAGTSLGHALVTVDNDRSPLLRAAGTPFERVTNLTCDLPTTSIPWITEDEEWAYFYVTGNDPSYPKGIYRSALSGADRQQIVGPGFFGEGYPDGLLVSRDGSTMVFQAERRLGSFSYERALWAARTDGSSPRKLADEFVPVVGFTPDGQAVVALRNQALEAIPLDGLSPSWTLFESELRLDEVHLAPGDHHALVLTRDDSEGWRSVFLVDLVTGEAAQLFERVYEDRLGPAAWSNDGGRVALALLEPGEVRIYTPAGNVERTLALPAGADDPFFDSHPGSWEPVPDFQIWQYDGLSWSGRGDELAFHGLWIDSCAAASAIVRMGVETGEVERLAWTDPGAVCGSFHVATFASGAWTGRGELHHDRRLRRRLLDLDGALPDDDGRVRVRLHQQGPEVAQVDALHLEVDGQRLAPGRVLDLATGEDVTARLAYVDGDLLEAAGRLLEAEWPDLPPGRKVMLSLVAREERLAEPTRRGVLTEPRGTSRAAASATRGAEAVTAQASLFPEDHLLDGYGQVVWDPNDRILFYADDTLSTTRDSWVLHLDEERATPLFEGWQGFQHPTFTPTGRQMQFSSFQDRNDPASPCHLRGEEDHYLLHSLMNLTADLRARRSAGGGVRLEGTAADLHLARWWLDYAEAAQPQVWRPILPPEAGGVVDGPFTTWVPPGPGSYLVRLTVEDRAGNRRQRVRRVASSSPTAVTDLYLEPRFISPNGDGVQDAARLHYRVLQPVHLDVDVLDDAGRRVRTFTRDHAEVGSVFELPWDGRDDQGQAVPDGEYTVSFGGFEFPVVVDSTAPEVEALLQPARHCPFPATGPVRIEPELHVEAADPHFVSLAVERGSGAEPTRWLPVPMTSYESGRPATFAFRSGRLSLPSFVDQTFRVQAVDRAGNRTFVSVPRGREELVLTAFGSHRLDPVTGRLEPLDEALCPASFQVEHGAVRFSVTETVRRPVVAVAIQFQPADEASGTWFSVPVGRFLGAPEAGVPEAEWTFTWDLAGLEPGRTARVRLRAVDAEGQEHLSEPFHLRTDGILLERAPLGGELPDDVAALLRAADTEPADQPILWAREFVAPELAEALLLVESADDPRYAVTRRLPPLAQREGLLVYRLEDWAACSGYFARVEARTVPVAGTGGTFVERTITSGGVALSIPCHQVHLDLQPLADTVCGTAEPDPVRRVELRPRSLDGSGLQLLTLSTVDAEGREEVRFSVNQPRDGRVYVAELDPRLLPAGRYELLARLRSVAGEETTSRATAATRPHLVVDRTPPVAQIVFPAAGQRVCGVRREGHNVLDVEARVEDASGVGFLLELAEDGGWTPIAGDLSTREGFLFEDRGDAPPSAELTGAVHAGVLGSLSDRAGDFTLRLRAVNNAGQQVCAETDFHFDGAVEGSHRSAAPTAFSPNGDGLVDEVALTFGAAEATRATVTVDPAERLSSTSAAWDDRCRATGPAFRTLQGDVPVLDGGQSSWDGLDDGGERVADGLYGLDVRLRDGCGNETRLRQCVVVDTTPPGVSLTAPQPGEPLGLVVEVRGSVRDRALQGWALEYGAGSDPQTWAWVAGGTGAVEEAVLGHWNTFGLAGEHTLRLRAVDRVGNEAEARVVLVLASPVLVVSDLAAEPLVFSPNGDGRRDALSVRFGLTADASVELVVLDAGGAEVARLLDGGILPAGGSARAWDGLAAGGLPAPDGTYRIAIRSRLAHQPTVFQEEEIRVELDRTPPALLVLHPPGPFVAPVGDLRVSIGDANLVAYRVELADDPQTPAWVELDQGAGERQDWAVGRLEDLSEGDYALRITARDAGESTAERRLDFTVDATPPVVTLLTPAPGEVRGAVGGAVEVRAEAEEEHPAQWRLEAGAGSDPGTWTLLASGDGLPLPEPVATWSLEGLADGPWTLRLAVEDRAGLRGEARSIVTVDGTPPEVRLSAPADGAFVRAPGAVAGRVRDAHLAEYVVAVAAAGSSRFTELGRGAATVDEGPLAAWLDLPEDGPHRLRLTATDAAGNVASTTATVTVDTMPPAPPRGVTATVGAAGVVEVSWQAATEADLAGYAVHRGGRLTPELLSSTSFSEPEPGEGTFLYTVSAFDRAGNESAPSEAAEVRVDRTPPSVALDRPRDGARVSGVIDVRATVADADDLREARLSVRRSDGTGGVQILGRSTLPLRAESFADWDTTALPDGVAHLLRLEAEDGSGNVAAAEVAVEVDNLPPAAPTGLSATVSGGRVDLAWDASSEADLDGYLLFRDGRVANASGPVVGELTAFLLRASGYADEDRPDGTFVYEVHAVDRAGNLSVASAAVSATVERRAPSAVLVRPESGTVFEETVVLVAESQDTDLAEVRFEAREVGSSPWVAVAPAVTAEPWQVTWSPAPLPYGDYEVRAVATDRGSRTDPAPAVSVLTYGDHTPPPAVADLTATVDGGEVTLHWETVEATDLAGYVVDRHPDSGAPVRRTPEPVVAPPFVDADVADGHYRYEVRAVDATGNEAEASPEADAVVYTPVLAQPRTPTAGTSVRLEGTAAPGASVEGEAEAVTVVPLAPVVADGDGVFAFADVPLLPGENTFRVTAADADGNRSRTAQVRVLSDAPPAPPQGLQAEVGGDLEVSLSWIANGEPDVLGYRLLRDGLPQPPPAPALGATASGSPSTAAPPSAVVDGDPATFWRSPFTVSETELVLEWPEAQPFAAVEIDWRFEGAVDFDLEGWDGDAWVPLARVRGDWTAASRVEVDPPYRTSRLRLAFPFARTTEVREVRASAHVVEAATTRIDLAPEGLHEYRVVAVDHFGLESPPSSAASAAVGDVTPPEAVTLTASAQGSDVLLSWTASSAPDLDHYRVVRDGQPLAETGETTLVDPSLVNGVYRYVVHALDVVGNRSEPSDEARVEIAVDPPAAPPAPRVTAPPAGGALEVVWDAVPGAVGYRLQRSTASGGPYEAVATTSALAHRDEGLANGTTYYYVLVAVDGPGNESPTSPEASATPADTEGPAAPVLHHPGPAGIPVVVGGSPARIVGRAEPGTTVVVRRDGTSVASLAAAAEERRVAPWGSLSPDGRWLALEHPAVLRNLDSGEERLLSEDGGPSRWVPGSESLVVASWEAVQHFGVDGTLLQQVSMDDVETFAVAPDGSFALLSGGREVDGDWREGLWRFDLGDGGLDLVLDGYSVGWDGRIGILPDGRGAVLVREEVVEVLDLGEPGLVPVPVAAAPGFGHALSPDGGFLLYLDWVDGYQAFVLDLSVGTSVQVTDEAYGIEAAAWDPTGAVLFVPRRTYEPGEVPAILAVPVRGGDPEPLVLLGEVDVYGLAAVSGGYLLLDAYPEPLRIAPAGRFEATVALEPGENVLTASARDDAGNAGPASQPLVVVLPASGLPDLVLAPGSLAVAPAAPFVGESVRVSARVTNHGAAPAPASDLALVVTGPDGFRAEAIGVGEVPPLAPGASETVTGEVVLDGPSGLYTVVAQADSAGRLAEAVEGNNAAELRLPVGEEGRPLLLVSTDRPVYEEGEPITARVEVTSFGSALSGHLTVRVVDAGGFEVDPLLETAIPALDPGETRRFDLAWNPGDVFAGDYQVIAELAEPTGAETSASASFRLVEHVQLAASVATDRGSYRRGDRVGLDGTVRYLAGNAPASGLEARLRVTGPDGEPVAEWLRRLGDLLPGAAGTVEEEWESAGSPAGTYRAHLDLHRDGEALATAETVFDLVVGEVQAAGTVTPSDPAPGIGTPVEVSWSARLLAGGPVAAALRLELLDPSGRIAGEVEIPTTLATGAAAAGTHTFATSGLGLGSHLVVLSAAWTGEGGEIVTVILDAAGFATVDGEPPQVEILAPLAGAVVPAGSTLEVRATDRLSSVARVEAAVGDGPFLRLERRSPTEPIFVRDLGELADGDHSVLVRAADAWVNLSPEATVPVTVDGTPPEIQVLGVEDGGLYIDPVRPEITVTDAHLGRHALTLDGAPFESGDEVATPGLHVLRIEAEDAAGNASLRVIGFEIAVPELPELSLAGAQAMEGQGPAIFTVTLSRVAEAPVTVDYVTADGSAVAGEDFQPVAGTLTFVPGELSLPVAVELVDDELPEADEVFLLRLVDASGAEIAVAEAGALVADDDEAPPAGCAAVPFSEEGFNVLVFGNAILANSDVEGRLAVGGSAQLSNYSVGLLSPTGGDALVVGTHLVFAHGTVHGGDVAYGVSHSLSGVSVPDGTVRQATPLDFPALRSSAQELADGLAALAPNGTTSITPWNAITLTGSDPDLNVFAVSGDRLAQAVEVRVQAPAGSTVVAVVDGTSGSLQNFAFFLEGVERERVVWSYPQATSLTVQSIGVEGSLLAPRAAVQFDNGVVHGALVAASLQGNGQSNRRPFAGCLPGEGPPPEPILVSLADLDLPEGDDPTVPGEALVRLVLEPPAPSPVRVELVTADGTAEAGEDYQAVAPTVEVAAGEAEVAVAVPILGDRVLEGPESFQLRIAAVEGAGGRAVIGRGEATVTLLDDETCAGPDLIRGGDGEAPDSLAAWNLVVGGPWSAVEAAEPDLAAPQGERYLAAGDGETAEIAQEVDLSALGGVIDLGELSLGLRALVRTGDRVPADASRIVVELLDEAGAVLDTFDSGPVTSVDGWSEIEDQRLPPAGTRRARVRLVGHHGGAESDGGEDDGGEGDGGEVGGGDGGPGPGRAEAWFDAVSLVPSGTPLLLAGDARIEEPGAGETALAEVELRLTCALTTEVAATWSTRDGTAVAPDDYAAVAAAPVAIPPREAAVRLPVEVFPDSTDEEEERFTVEISAVQGATLLDGSAEVRVSPPAGCAAVPFSEEGFNVLVFGDAILANSDVEGRLAVGGSAQLSSYSVGLLSPTGGDVLVVGTHLVFAHGTVHGGDVAYGVSHSLSGVSFPDGTVRQATPLDFPALRSAAQELADGLAALVPNGTTSITPWNAITLTGSDPDLNVFAVPGDRLAQAVEVRVQAPAGSTVVAVVDGTSGSLQNFAFFLEGVERERVVWSYPQATSLTVQSIGVEGSLLAPRAAVQFNNGVVHGALVAASLQGNGQSNRRPFAGCLPGVRP